MPVVSLPFLRSVLKPGLFAYWQMVRGMTLGVRVMLIEEGQVLLVKHSYMPGWYLPGGGVERGETIHDAAAREIHEEAGAVLGAPPALFGFYYNGRMHPRDHVALLVAREWTQPVTPKVPNREIIALDRFPLDALPADATPATRRRIDEVLNGKPPSPLW
ncbi:ADP-ribose pyrophosphatase YjhB, NUDIX family [Faunimonas pinastri]|uniref:ADP-ribose pyrophosphatase YjhB, NUDIX family n=1 Tax=Faunimonas pinastri TaxID=1855383 RepID=A0A1H9ACT6_9HYPH|nr:NUDIX domain-containing protein [Faunimonas pinastri]SEP74490.1 ADP-ribose pyrophosphatase YjhB, NUDIX family [Faunimonas pinastri]